MTRVSRPRRSASLMISNAVNCLVMAPLLFTVTATTEIHTLSLHDALPIWTFVLSTHRLNESLPDLYWLTILGKPYIELFGRDRVLSSPAHKIGRAHV